jgi:hypothetical protein
MITLKMLRFGRRWQLLFVVKTCLACVALRLKHFLPISILGNMEDKKYYNENLELSDTDNVFDFEVLKVLEDNVSNDSDT